jgi:hypothetical protein
MKTFKAVAVLIFGWVGVNVGESGTVICNPAAARTHRHTSTDTDPTTEIQLLKRLLVTFDAEVGKPSKKSIKSKSIQV